MRRAAAAVVVALLAGCGGQLAGSQSEDEVRIGFVPKSLNQEFWVNTKKGAEAGGRESGAQVVTQAAGSDLEIAEQIDIVENLLAQHIDALVIAPSSADILKPVLERAAAEIPVVLIDSDIPGWKPKTAYVGTENVVGGRKAGRYIAEKLDDGGELAIIAGIPGSQVGIERVDGLKQGLEEGGGGVKIVKELPGNFERDQAVGAMEDILQTNPDVDAVFAANDQMALGAIESIGARKKTDQIMLVGFDGALEATQKIIAGEMEATVAQDPYGMGKIGVQTAQRRLDGESVKRKVNTGARMVTPDNAERYFEEVRGKLGGTGRGLGG
jgi:ribose transport system substrate-binding protein